MYKVKIVLQWMWGATDMQSVRHRQPLYRPFLAGTFSIAIESQNDEVVVGHVGYQTAGFGRSPMWKFQSAAGEGTACWRTINELLAALTPLRLSDPDLSTLVPCAIAGWPNTIYTWSLSPSRDLCWSLSMPASVQPGKPDKDSPLNPSPPWVR